MKKTIALMLLLSLACFATAYKIESSELSGQEDMTIDTDEADEAEFIPDVQLQKIIHAPCFRGFLVKGEWVCMWCEESISRGDCDGQCFTKELVKKLEVK